MVETARTLNPGIQLLIRAYSEEEAKLLEEGGQCHGLLAEDALAEVLGDRVIAALKPKA